MTRLLDFVVYMTVLTWISIMLGAALRNREWTLEGMKVGLSNRDHLPEATAGAAVLWARVVYLPVYLLGITYLRSAIWGVGIVGLGMMLLALL